MTIWHGMSVQLNSILQSDTLDMSYYVALPQTSSLLTVLKPVAYCFIFQTGQPGGGTPGGPQQQPQQQQPGGAPQQPGQGAPQQQQPPYGQPYGYQAAAAAGYYGGAPGI